VDAFAVNTDTGYTFHGLQWKPRLGVHIDGASGGASRSGGTINTYQPMYPNTQYYVPNNEFAPTNFYDVAPRIGVSPTPTVFAEFYYSFLWRYSQADAIYTGAPWPGGNGQNNYAVTVLTPGRVIGRQADFRVTWTIAPHLLAQGPQGIELLVVELRAAMHARFADLRQPRGTVARCIDLLAGAGDGPTAVQRFYPRHHSC
jgi:hypothetical protein